MMTMDLTLLGRRPTATHREEARRALKQRPQIRILDQRPISRQARGNNTRRGLELRPERGVDGDAGFLLGGGDEDGVELQVGVVEADGGADGAEDAEPEDGVDF